MFLHVKHMCRVGRLWASEAFTVRTTSDQEFSQHLAHINVCAWVLRLYPAENMAAVFLDV